MNPPPFFFFLYVAGYKIRNKTNSAWPTENTQTPKFEYANRRTKGGIDTRHEDTLISGCQHCDYVCIYVWHAQAQPWLPTQPSLLYGWPWCARTSYLGHFRAITWILATTSLIVMISIYRIQFPLVLWFFCNIFLNLTLLLKLTWENYKTYTTSQQQQQ